MRPLLALVRRELWRFFSQPSGYGLAVAFYLTQASFFCLLVQAMLRPQPQYFPPERVMYSGGYLLALYAFALPALAVRAFAEERLLGTFDVLVASGLGRARLAIGKFMAAFLILALLQLLALPLPLLLLPHARVDGLAVLAAHLGLLGVGAFWLAAALLASCRFSGLVSAYFAAFLTLFLLWFFPYFRGVLPESLYRPLFDTFDFDALLNRTSQGLIHLYDMVFLAGGTLLLVLASALLLETEKGSRWRFAGVLAGGAYAAGAALALYCALLLAHRAGTVFDVSLRGRAAFSPEFRRILAEFPRGGRMTLMLPAHTRAGCYDEAREIIASFARRAAGLAGMEFRDLDPDLDLLEIDRLRQTESLPANVIGGVLLRHGERSTAIPYHQLITLTQLTQAGDAIPAIQSFHGEEQFATALRTLLRKGAPRRALLIQGAGELDLASGADEGGSLFHEMLQQLGVEVVVHRPGIEEPPELGAVSLALWLDPRLPAGEPTRALLAGLFAQRVPLLAAKGALLGPAAASGAWKALAAWGLVAENRPVVQKAFRLNDPFLLPARDYAGHPLAHGLEEATALFYLADSLREGVPADPRVLVAPLLRSERHDAIWAESDAASARAGNFTATFGPGDTPSPLLLAATAEFKEAAGTRPLLALLASRAPLENRFIDQGANRGLVFRCADWLLNGEKRSLLPPRRPEDFRLALSSRDLLKVQALALGAVPGLLVLFGTLVLWRRR